VSSRIKIDRQSDLNIGTAGHVDHGKCIGKGSTVYIPRKGHCVIEDIWRVARDRGRLLLGRDGEWLYYLDDLYVLSIDLHDRRLIFPRAYLYVQRYSGDVFRIKTEGGRSITVSPDHPLLTYNNGIIRWSPSYKLDHGDNIGVVKECSLDEAMVIGEEWFKDKMYVPRSIISPDCYLGPLSDRDYLEFERIDDIERIRYDDYLFDLNVPGIHTFVGGDGGIILHNTTIIEALTGIWTSSHSEELRRGITIRIGYADMPIYRIKSDVGEIYWSRPSFKDYGDGELVRVVSFVDCPGHESLMANMLSGATVMDGAMLVIAANESVPRPQTKEHSMALQILGIKNVVVVQNKIDLVSKSEAKKNYDAIKEFLSTTDFPDAPIIPLSAIHKVNLHYLVEALYKYIPIPKRDLDKPFRMFVIRSFDINRPGTFYKDLRGGVIGGSIIQGRVRVGDEIEILPGYLSSEAGKIVNEPLYTNVYSLRTQNTSLKEAFGGGLIGIQTDLDPYMTKSDNLVGNIAGEPDTLPEVRYEFDMEFNLFKYVVGTDETIEVKPINVNDRLRLNVGPAVTLGLVTSVGREKVHVKLHRPVVAEDGWRVAIATRVNNMWRLVGVGSVC
jgi:translation initiation factor 2 subunit 3